MNVMSVTAYHSHTREGGVREKPRMYMNVTAYEKGWSARSH